jgi:hypothetical protein
VSGWVKEKRINKPIAPRKILYAFMLPPYRPMSQRLFLPASGTQISICST